jgi:hypothetical protein
MARWYRAYEGTTTDPKLAEAAMIAGASRSVVIATWHAILEACATANAGGDFDLPPRRVAVLLVEPISLIEQTFGALSELGLIAGNTVVRWRERQYESDKSAARTRAYRERMKTSQPVTVTPCDVTVTSRDVTVTPPETETETDTETKIVITPNGVTPNKVLEDAISGWNDLAAVAGLAGVQRLTEPRRRALKARLSEAGGIDGWLAMLERIRDSAFLTGGNDRGWRADFDFVVKESNFTKIMEGKYDQREQLSAAQRAAKRILTEETDDAFGEIFKSLPF